MLKAIKLNGLQIKRAIEDVDVITLPRHILLELVKSVPTDEEV